MVFLSQGNYPTTKVTYGHLILTKSNAGRKPTDVIVMFKLLILQQVYAIRAPLLIDFGRDL